MSIASPYSVEFTGLGKNRGRYWQEDIETLPRSRLEAVQLERLKTHLAWAYQRSPYYRKAFDDAGVHPRRFRALSDIQAYPFVDKRVERDRQMATPLLGDMLAVPEREVVFVSASSGSTGTPTLSPFTAQDFDTFQDIQARLFWAAGMRPDDRYVHALNFTLFVGGPDVIGAQRLGALCFWAGAVPSVRLLYIMREFQPTMTWTTPSYAWHLGETARAQGIDPARDLSIRRIIVAGEPGGSIPATREAIEAIWGAKLFDFYGISDIYGACAGMCEARDGLHLVEDDLLLEVLDPDTGEPVEDGTPGEMVLTTLTKRARPMIRFRTGDIVTADRSPCACGRTHARIKVIGRRDDMIIINGVNVFPCDVECVIRAIPGVSGEYRIVVYKEDHLSRFDIELERADKTGDPEALRRRVVEDIKTRLGVRPREVRLLEPGSLPRTTHKAKRVLDLRKE
ncbi:phenylacetate--CoA ligase family protein [Ectothiorhodospira lacustris]|uniref:phenylacetate--CoA ligase family protein n=1 Tax=Ectothiorhodospira lacustris TaxID=2899127 RepID=UPI001EE96B80|nr:phenylacetate--CoA ligase [Ectothiorhodospira lacustris]MCG5501339.1 phenylacetate--CoA ligase [Ectothiorhodospira lacustris]